MPKFKTSQKLNSQGSVIITVFLSLMVVVGIYFIYYYYTQLNSLGPPSFPLVKTTPPPNDETANWKPYEDMESGISLKIPKDWYIGDDHRTVSQFPYDPKRFSSVNIYNNFSINRSQYQLQSGYTNTDWLSKIDNLKPNEKLTNEYRPATSLQLVKLSSGQTADGLHYVVFKNTSLDEGIIGAFEKDNSVYLFVLQHYDQAGIDTFQKIIATAQVIISPPSP